MTTTIHHPSCPQREGAQLACFCGPEAQAEDRVILMERTPDAMLLDILAAAYGAQADWIENAHTRGRAKGLLSCVLLDNELASDEPMARSWGAK